ncbi:MAG: hypothetical protein ACREFL_16315, partial [Stellaceae bacterium]
AARAALQEGGFGSGRGRQLIDGLEIHAGTPRAGFASDLARTIARAVPCGNPCAWPIRLGQDGGCLPEFHAVLRKNCARIHLPKVSASRGGPGDAALLSIAPPLPTGITLASAFTNGRE